MVNTEIACCCRCQTSCIVPFCSHRHTVPAHDGVGRHDRSDVLQSLAAQDLALHSQPLALIIVENDPLFSNLLSEDLIFSTEVVNNSLLFAVHDAGQDGEEEMLRLKHLICHRFNHVWEKTIASLGRDLAG